MRDLNAKKYNRFLVIDDNPAIHEDFRKILVSDSVSEGLKEAESAFFGETSGKNLQMNIELDVAHQGQVGLEKAVAAVAENRPYALAFVDMRMPPGWDGLTTIEKLWKVDPTLQAVICTAYSDHSWSDISRRLEQPDRLLILKKPFDSAEVLQIAAAVIEKCRLAQKAALKTVKLEELVTERTRYLKEAQQESERLLAAIDSLLVGIDKNGVVQRWNERAAQMFGIAECDAVGKPFGELAINWEDRERILKLLSPEQQVASIRVEAVFRDSGGPQRVVGFSCYPIHDGNKRRGAVLLGTELTEQRLLEQQLQQAQKLESVGQLAAGVAHEINTPMQYLGDNLDFLQNKMGKLETLQANFVKFADVAEQTDEERELLADMRAILKKLKAKSFLRQVSEAIDDSRDGVQHVSRIVRAMKEFAHPGQDERTPVDINRALEATIAVSTNEWKYVAEVETKLDASIPLVPAIAGELNQVFLNILVNAAHAIGDTNDGGATEKGTITLSTRRSGNCVEVSIADSGTGIPDEIKERVFDPFFTTKEVGKGTGQGLAIAHSVVVQKYGGTLRCESSPGVGTTFFIQLPVELSGKDPHDELESTMVCE